MDLSTRVQILDHAILITHSTNTLGKGMNSTIPLPQSGINNISNWAFQCWYGNQSKRRKILNLNQSYFV